MRSTRATHKPPSRTLRRAVSRSMIYLHIAIMEWNIRHAILILRSTQTGTHMICVPRDFIAFLNCKCAADVLCVATTSTLSYGLQVRL